MTQHRAFLTARGYSVRQLLHVTVLAVFSVGCSDGANPYPVRSDVARQTLETALDAWKAGTEPSMLREHNPTIVVQDLDWSAGTQLTAYELVNDGKSVGANLSIEVHLELKNKAGNVSQKNVWYLVGTDPALTVFRDMFH
ncbi:hypothetical protein [Fuerstiella marisgermanici]|nr:hypothetical protein [Fuerstiella marisgermanici]